MVLSSGSFDKLTSIENRQVYRANFFKKIKIWIEYYLNAVKSDILLNNNEFGKISCNGVPND